MLHSLNFFFCLPLELPLSLSFPCSCRREREGERASSESANAFVTAAAFSIVFFCCYSALHISCLHFGSHFLWRWPFASYESNDRRAINVRVPVLLAACVGDRVGEWRQWGLTSWKCNNMCSYITKMCIYMHMCIYACVCVCLCTCIHTISWNAGLAVCHLRLFLNSFCFCRSRLATLRWLFIHFGCCCFFFWFLLPPPPVIYAHSWAAVITAVCVRSLLFPWLSFAFCRYQQQLGTHIRIYFYTYAYVCVCMHAFAFRAARLLFKAQCNVFCYTLAAGTIYVLCHAMRNSVDYIRNTYIFWIHMYIQRGNFV